MFFFLRALRALLVSAALLGAAAACATAPQTLAALAPSLAVGDIVFTRIPFAPFTKITEVTGGWANHVGAIPSSMPADDMYDAISRGALDGTMVGIATAASTGSGQFVGPGICRKWRPVARGMGRLR